jgi:hypothetical protein
VGTCCHAPPQVYPREGLLVDWGLKWPSQKRGEVGGGVCSREMGYAVFMRAGRRGKGAEEQTCSHSCSQNRTILVSYTIYIVLS